jgi:hypothetical protein
MLDLGKQRPNWRLSCARKRSRLGNINECGAGRQQAFEPGSGNASTEAEAVITLHLPQSKVEKLLSLLLQ